MSPRNPPAAAARATSQVHSSLWRRNVGRLEARSAALSASRLMMLSVW
jgi:hypothetical protein